MTLSIKAKIVTLQNVILLVFLCNYAELLCGFSGYDYDGYTDFHHAEYHYTEYH